MRTDSGRNGVMPVTSAMACQVKLSNTLSNRAGGMNSLVLDLVCLLARRLKCRAKERMTGLR